MKLLNLLNFNFLRGLCTVFIVAALIYVIRYLREELSQRNWEQGSVTGKPTGSCLVTKSGNMMPLALFFLKIVLAIWSLLCFHTNFTILCNCPVKNAFGIFSADYVKLAGALGSMVIFQFG